jgi:glycosyltransferase involved in cell wall biosynthesis
MQRRVLLWHWGRYGGGPRYTYELARALARRDDVLTHLSYSRQSEFADAFAALPVATFPVDTYTSLPQAMISTLRLPWLRRRFAAYLVEQRIDTVVCTMGHLWNVAVAPVIAPTGALYLLTLHDSVAHSGEESRSRAFHLKRELAMTDGVITLTRHVRDQLITLHGYPTDRNWILPHGVFLSPQAGRRSYPEKKFRILFFGRILLYKGFDLLVDAYERLAAHHGARLTLQVAGKGDLSPFKERLDRLPNVTIRNEWIPEDELPALFAQADLVVLPYREASQSGVVPTAYGAGLPVVATPVGGLVEQIEHGVTGLLTSAVTGEAVAAAVSMVIDQPALYERMSAAAVDHAKHALSWDGIAAGLMEIVGEARPLRRGTARQNLEEPAPTQPDEFRV